MRILILNWRCPSNPNAGGAELVTYEIARRLVAQGNYVEWFASSFQGAAPQEDLGGIHIVRAGRQWTVHWAAFRRYRGKLRDRFDVVIDEVNTVPFFTPLWADVPRFMFIHQLAREVWWYESRFPINLIGYLLEPLYLRVYRRTRVFTVSRSTEQDLIRLGFSGPIVIVPEGLEPISRSTSEKCQVPTFLYVGRIAPSKRLDAILLAFSLFRQTIGAGQLWLVGDGRVPYIKKLEGLVRRQGLERSVKFLGRVSTAEKHERMSQAHALVLASAREGWGLCVTEANALGTPAIAYDVPGLRDSIRHGKTGLLVPPSAASLAEGMVRLWSDPGMYQSMARAATSWSSSFTFERSAETLRNELERGVLVGAN